MESMRLIHTIARHPVWTLLVVLVAVFAVLTLLVVFAGQQHVVSYTPR
jgi:hypothetical protein